MTQTFQTHDLTPLNGTYVDLVFPAFGNTIPLDHGYVLYGAVAKQVAWLHGEEAKRERAGVFPVRGVPGGDGTLLLGAGSALRFRVPAARLPLLLTLAGRTLTLDRHTLHVGVPTVAALKPAAAVVSPLVLIKLADAGHKDIGGVSKPEAFLAAARRQLDALEIAGQAQVLTHAQGDRAGQPRRRVVRVKGQTHVGYGLLVTELTAEESIRLQEHGIGGRRQMGCGLFLPAGEAR